MADDKTYTPLLPYDSTLGEHFTTYDTMPYQCNRDLCHPNIAKESGNIVKYYAYILKPEATKI